MPWANRIGHLGPEPHYLLTLFAGIYDQIVLLIPRSADGLNAALLDCLRPDFTVIQTDNKILLFLSLINDGIIDYGEFHGFSALINRFYREYTVARSRGVTMRHLSPHPRIIRRGEAWLNSLGFDEAQPFVTVHVRDQSYIVEGYRRGAGDLRSASLGNFESAIPALIDQGLAVFRIGDRQSPALGVKGGVSEVVEI